MLHVLFVGTLTGNLASPPMLGVPIVPSPAGCGVTRNFSGTATLKSLDWSLTNPWQGWLAVMVSFLAVNPHTSMICSEPLIVYAVPAVSPAVVAEFVSVPHFRKICLPVLTEDTTSEAPMYGATVFDINAVP